MGLFHDAVTMKANIDVLAGTNLGFYVKVQGREFVGKKGIRAARVPLNWNGPIGKMAAAGLEEGLTAMSDFLHTAFSVSREEYAEMVQECKDEWETSRTTINYQVVYFEKAQDRLKDD
ncbi:hypothetical protein HK100_011021 [Physocladia obscura]|uniref:Uncharacterized protein n=1 Tax=Physocladia obscura TaxID=109957 RepID=A0AAD5T7W5_9FUNG|nr:hypothetical protein HK100_011021 [Physocladia obscura]